MAALVHHIPHFTSIQRRTFQSPPSILSTLRFTRNLSARAIDPSSETQNPQQATEKEVQNDYFEGGNGSLVSEEYPSGDFEYREFDGWKTFVVKLRMLVAYPWQRVKKGSVLTMKLRGQVQFI